MRAFLIIAFALSTASLYSQDDNIARVNRISGKEIFIGSEPIKEYEVVFRFEPKGFVGVKNFVSEASALAVKTAFKISEKEGKQFDAIILSEPFTKANSLAIEFIE